MAIGASTFNDIGGGVSDIFAGLSAEEQAQLKAQGLDIEAEGTQISSEADLLKAQGDIAEGQEYTLAQTLAAQNAQYTAASTNIQAIQNERQVTGVIGSGRAAAGGSGLAESGSALDVMASSAQQGALSTAVLRTQGAITEAGEEEQAASYGLMANAANSAATTETTMAGQEQTIATQQQQLASETAAAGNQSELGSFAASALKGVAAVATIVTGLPVSTAFTAISDTADPTVAGTLY